MALTGKDWGIFGGAIAVAGIAGLIFSQPPRGKVVRVEVQQRDANTEIAQTPYPANETGEIIPPIDAAQYVLLTSKKLGNGNVEALSRRYSEQSGASYARREFDCTGGRGRYLGSGETRDVAEKGFDKPDPFGPLVSGSSAHRTAQVACEKYGMEVKGAM